MSSESNDEKVTRCNMCNKVVFKLVPLYDNDQAHKGICCCRDCKRKIRAGLPIVKFEGTPGELNE